MAALSMSIVNLKGWFMEGCVIRVNFAAWKGFV
jgi:hypothetical protein